MEIVKEKSDFSDRILHSVSMQIAALLSDSEPQNEEDREEWDDLLMAYRCIRRHIKVNPNTGKRYGAEQASKMISGELD